MSPVIRWNHNLFALLFCILAVAICCRLNTSRTAATAGQVSNPSQNAQVVRNRALGEFVGGAIGVQSERGDRVTVVNYSVSQEI